MIAATTGAAIGIICKTPQAGASKTRLAPLVGVEGAAMLAACFLRDVAAAIEGIPAGFGRKGYAVYAPAGSEAALKPLLPDDFGLICRRGASLGEVLLGATEELLGLGHDCVLLVNGDSPTLPSVALADAITALRAQGERVALGPAIDGGYWFIGLKSAHAGLFTDIPWSTPAVFETTLARAQALGLEVAVLPTWYDVDDAESFAILRSELAGEQLSFGLGAVRGTPASATRAFLTARPDLGLAAAE
jgi:uncharacterized protein